MGILQHAVVPSTGGYQIERSLRFNSADSAYLSRTPGSAGNRQKFTWSGWVKRSGLTATNTLFGAGTAGDNYCFLYFQNDDKLVFYNYSAAGVFPIRSTNLYRDVSAWYHIVLSVDTTQATASNRVKLYVNNEQITSFSEATYPDQNDDLVINSTVAHAVGAFLTGSPSGYLNGYMTDVYFIDGQALTPSSFGENDTDTGVWKPKAYSGTYGTNGFYLKFADNSGTTSTTLGKDSSGNGNNWTPNNFSVTAGDGNDSLVDTPTPYGTDTGAGGEVRGNYATLNPLAVKNASAANGNLDGTVNGGEPNYILGTISVSSGKWYWEWVPTANLVYSMAGITKADSSTIGWQTANSWAYYYNGSKYTNNTSTSYGATFALNDVIGVALDMDAGTVTFYKNGVSQGTAFSSLTGPMVPYFGSAGAGANAGFTANFGQRPFAYTAPSGFKALCTTNLPTPAIGATSTTRADDYFNTVLYTGNGSSRSITGVGFQPGFTWIKDRSVGFYHRLADAVRGAGKELYSNDTGAETTNSVNGYVTSFDSDGFSLGTGIGVNQNGTTYVAWNWKANGAGSSNTQGTITSTVSANTTSGFSIVTYTGTGSNATVGHGLGVAPKFFIVKQTGATSNWNVYHASLGATKGIRLNLTNAEETSSGYWNDTAPTSTVISLGNGTSFTSGGVIYAFAEVAGYSAFGSYTGNGSTDGPFCFTGFKPKYILIKRTNDVADWAVWDGTRDTYNPFDTILYPNTSGAEATNAAYNIDALSNGFKIRNTATSFNGNASTFIYAAFAEVPTKFALAS
jgi:hypothetical protein